MPNASAQPDNNATMAFDGPLTVAQVGTLVNDLKAKVAEGQSVALDLSGVERIDAAGLQLLYLLNNETDSADAFTGVAITCISSTCTDAARFLGLALQTDAEDGVCA
jgi:ABC-type transporter Mla MlaB component